MNHTPIHLTEVQSLGTLGIDPQRMKERLRELVHIESPSDDSAAVNRAHDLVERWARESGAEAVVHSNDRFGDVRELHFPGESSRKPLLILGHLDTVWPLGTLAHMPWREEPDEQGRLRLWGPGVLDMKAGVVMALEAIAALQRERRAMPPVILLLNPDEEVGSDVSRPITESLARQCSAVFVLEPAQGLDRAAYKTARKGVGVYRLHVKGVASHSGVDFESGHSAILELARLLLKVERFTDLGIGVTVNPGVIRGGTRSNVIAAEASAEVDVRVATLADAARIDRLFHSLACEDSACSLTVSGGLNRPPMERSEGTLRLFEQAREIAEGMGISLDEAATGGGSDGNFTAAIGVPTLDGMGAVGEGAHAIRESLLLEHLAPRTFLLARMIERQ